MKFEKVNPATGAAAPGFSRGSDKYSKNQWSGHSNDGREVNFGRGPTKGNTDNTAHEGKRPQAAGVPSNTKIKNPDYINGGAQVRTPGGTRAWAPSAGQNYKGNIDSMNVGRGPTKGNQQ
jgi:hypothetical protein